MEEDIGRANTVEVQGVVDKGISVENKHKSKIRSCSTDTLHQEEESLATKTLDTRLDKIKKMNKSH